MARVVEVTPVYGNSEGKGGLCVRAAVFSPYLTTLGGGERYLASMIQTLANEMPVDILAFSHLDLSGYKRLLGIDLRDVSLRKLQRSERLNGVPYLRKWITESVVSRVSEEYELFINYEHVPFIMGRAQKNVYICHVPPAKHILRLSIASLGIDMSLKSYDYLIASSQFTRTVAEEVYRRPFELVYPPVAVHRQEVSFGEKEKIILSVGRFYPGAHSKRQLELIAAFKEVYRIYPTWSLHLVGGNSGTRASEQYLARCMRDAKGYPVFFHPNANSRDLWDLYEKATVYWHAKGLGADERHHPDQTEHFGISTVEAMSAGCIPIVIDSGGQREIVSHGVDGFRWQSPEEMIRFTLNVIANESLGRCMGAKAREKSLAYGVELFEENVNRILLPKKQVEGKGKL